MRATTRIARLIVPLLLLAGWPVPARAELDTLAGILSRVDMRYRGKRTASIAFTERYVSKLSSRTLEESGTLWLATPGRMRWQYQKPEEKLFVVDGETSWFYVPEDKVAYRSKTKASDARRLPALFLAGHGDITRDYQASVQSERAPGVTTFRLDPRRPGEDYEYVELDVEPASGTIRGLRIVDALGNLTAFEFRDERSPATLPEKAFEFSAPDGVDVVETGADPAATP